MIQLAPYDEAWPRMFEQEARRLCALFGELAVRIEHVGSTAVPGLSAKPVIDIQVSVAELAPFEGYRQLLASAGYAHVPLGDLDRVYPFFQKPAAWPCTHHLHLCASGGEQEARHLSFRDHLRRHPQVARQYLELKQRLAAQHHGKTQASRESYSLAKGPFVEAVLVEAMREAPAPPLRS